MVRYYRVAEHVFSVSMDEGCGQWNRMDNYGPFLTEEAPCVFSLELRRGCVDFEKAPLYFQHGDPGLQRMDLYRSGNDFLLEMAPTLGDEVCSRLLFNSDYSSAVLYVWGGDTLESFSLNNALMVMFAFATSAMNTLEMHASTVVNGEKGYMFLGKSGTGKSTHSRLWLENIPGTWLLNDDNPVVRVHDDGTVRVYGSPWSGKTPCYKNASATVGAFVRLRQAGSNSIARLGLPDSYAVLTSSSSAFKAHRKMADGIHHTISLILGAVPCYLLDCLPDRAAAELCFKNVA